MRKVAAVIALALVMSMAPMAFAEAPSNDDLAQAEEMTLPFSDSTDTIEATTQVGEPITGCEIRPTQNTVWYKYTPQDAGFVFFDTLGSNFDTITAVYAEAYAPSLTSVTGFEGLYFLGCQDPGIEDEFSLWLEEDVTYLFQLGGHIDQPGGLAEFNVALPGSITGRVTDESGAPLEDICVNAGRESEYYYGYGWTDWYRSDRTNANGEYEIRDLGAGSHLVSFYDCSWGDSREFYPEFYNDKPDPSDADQVEVALGTATTGIDAVLKQFIPRPPPPPVYTDLSVTDLQVTKVPIETDYGHVGYSGYVRDISTEVSNLSTQTAWAWLRVRACTDDGCSLIHSASIQIDAGEVLEERFRWDATGFVGDVSIVAEVEVDECNMYDSDSMNNERRVEHYVIVGGTGVSASPLAPPDYYYYEEDGYGYRICRFAVVTGGGTDSPPPPSPAP